MEAVPRAGILKLGHGVVTRVSGSAVDFHGRELPDVAAVWQFDVEQPAIVLGSRQTEDVLDVVACRERRVEIARRRSGGGVVLLVPGATEWIDVVVPAGDPRWDDDVTAVDGADREAMGRGAARCRSTASSRCIAGPGADRVVGAGVLRRRRPR